MSSAHLDMSESRCAFFRSRTLSTNLLSDGFCLTSWYDDAPGSDHPRFVRMAYDVDGHLGVHRAYYEAARVERTVEGRWFYRALLLPGARTGHLEVGSSGADDMAVMTRAMFTVDSYLDLYAVAPREFHRSFDAEHAEERVVPYLQNPVHSWRLLSWLRRHPLSKSSTRSYENRHVRMWAHQDDDVGLHGHGGDGVSLGYGSDGVFSGHGGDGKAPGHGGDGGAHRRRERSLPRVRLVSTATGSVGAMITRVSPSRVTWSVHPDANLGARAGGIESSEEDAFEACDDALSKAGCSVLPHLLDIYRP